MENEKQQLITETKNNLRRMQEFDSQILPRIEELGRQINFKDAVDPANRLVDLYIQLPIEVLDVLPNNFLNRIKSRSVDDYNRLEQILKFEAGTPKEQKDALIRNLVNSYDSTFEQLHPIISYSVRKSTDFEKLERDAKTKVQEIKDEADKLTKRLEAKEKQAEVILKYIQKAAEEHGVSQQAFYFKQDAEEHDDKARTWLRATIWLTIVLIGYALLAMHSHLLSWLKPENNIMAIQISVGKILVFAAISFILGLSAKSYLAHKHNAVVNKHRQNALVTYEALVKAAGDGANRDIVLTKVADAIFSAQSTGYSKSDDSDGRVPSILSITPQILKQVSKAEG